ncbi:2-dehydropantoate 2-reductase N-terminal domain-containing protein [Dankookia rubra]
MRIDSLRGDADLRPPTVQAGDLGGPYDLILFAVKAYSLDAAMEDNKPDRRRDCHSPGSERHATSRTARRALRVGSGAWRRGPDTRHARPGGTDCPSDGA